MLKILVTFFTLLSCTNKNDAEIVIATSADNPPYEFLQNGQIIGLDIELAEKISKKLGKKLVIKNIEFDGIIAALTSKKVDFAISGLTVTHQREKHVDFSKVYASSSVAIIKWKNFDEINILGAQLGTTWEIIAKQLSKSVRSLNNNMLLIEELKTKKVDGVIMEAYQAKKIVTKYPDFDYKILTEYTSNFAIAFPKGSTLLPKVNSILDILEESGELEQLKNKWLDV